MAAKAHLQFVSKTVLVRNGDIEEAMRSLNRVMGSEGLLDIIRRNRYYEKPWQERKRVAYEKCKAIYNSEMQRKVAFVMRKHRTNPWPN
ncbi:PREDICTED: 28S ribosomal protein S21, mitochondrial-like [Priapulus caudatus]|uniref:28S ribosomal protein S21, mitochondrial-like n=1 Tax=Priapulus caudatus TaxID=37621 RepID=A0ABM1EIL7_PRICU|nr:PREDICTED: 28S ribosomal protein S21, mitochondrial-like [Priapulus caudatus]